MLFNNYITQSPQGSAKVAEAVRKVTGQGIDHTWRSLRISLRALRERKAYITQSPQGSAKVAEIGRENQDEYATA